jgi:thiol-disulfide isomerase/thioredoxin
VGVEVGKSAPDLVWVDIDGTKGSLSGLRGSPVLLDIWELECPFCIALFDELVKVDANYSSEGLTIVSIDIITWETEAQVRAERDDHNATWPFAIDGDNVQGRYDLWRLPTLILIDSAGVIQWTFTGLVHSSVISQEVERLI